MPENTATSLAVPRRSPPTVGTICSSDGVASLVLLPAYPPANVWLVHTAGKYGTGPLSWRVRIFRSADWSRSRGAKEPSRATLFRRASFAKHGLARFGPRGAAFRH